MKKITAIIFCLFNLANLFAQPVGHFYFQGAQMYDPCGTPFNMRGVNYAPYNWGNDANENVLRQIAKTGANTVRLVWYANDPNTAAVYTAAKLQAVLDTCTKYGMLPVIELHDRTCNNDHPALITNSNYFLRTDVKAVLMARQDKIVINIANEALYYQWTGNAATALTAYKTTYKTILDNMRNAGYYCTIMIDAPDCGTNTDALVAVGQELINYDIQHNLIFSAHAYWYGFANNDPVVMQQKIQTLINANIPYVLGEIANQQDDAQNCQYTLPYANLLTRCQNLNVNWLAWSWFRDVCPNRQMSTTGNYTNLTTYGNDLINNTTYGIKLKAVKSTYLMGNITCQVNTNEIEALGINIDVYNQYDAWQIISKYSENLKAQLYSINGQLLQTLTIAQNSDISIQKPSTRGIFILKCTDAKGNIISKKLVN